MRSPDPASTRAKGGEISCRLARSLLEALREPMARPNPMHEPAVHRLPSFVRTRVTGAPGSAWTLERGVFLTPYAAEEIAQEARRAGPGARLEVIVAASTSDAGVAAVENLFAWLREKGLTVAVHRGGPEG